nr:threonine-phosphate decarboxylase CobD [Sphingomonas laterariae]
MRSSGAGEWTFHGGRIDRARLAFADAPQPWIDLSTGINPWPWDAGRAGPIDWAALPDPSALARLKAAAAGHFGVDPAFVCALPGTEIGLRLLRLMHLPAPHRHVAPGYRTHGEALDRSRAIAADALAGEARAGGTILIANPNNPDGRLLAPAALRDAADALASAGGTLVVDEAFADAQDDTSILPHAADRPVIVLRSFGKFFGLAGLRLGFAVAHPDRLAPLRAQLGSWPLSTAAIAIGVAAYGDRPWITAMRQRLAGEAAALDALLARHGLVARGGCPLFRLVECDDAAALFTRLARHGVLSRPFDYDPRWLRLGLPGSSSVTARLDRALADG